MRKRDFEAGLLQEAYTRFKAYYKQQHAPPQAPALEWWFWVLIAVLVVVWVAAAWMSGIRTSEVFARISGHAAEGWLAIVVIEGVAGGLPLFGVINRYKRQGHVPDDSKINKSIVFIIALAITLGLIINVYSIMLAQHHEIIPVTWVVIVLAGAIATLTLAIIGHTIGMVYVIGVAGMAEAQQIYRDDMAAYEQAINEAWEDTRTQKHWMQMVKNEEKGESVQAVGRDTTSGQRPALSSASAMGFARIASNQVSTPGQKMATGQATASGGSKTEQLAILLRDNPNLNEMSYRDLQGWLAQQGIQVSRGTIGNAKELLNND